MLFREPAIKMFFMEAKWPLATFYFKSGTQEMALKIILMKFEALWYSSNWWEKLQTVWTARTKQEIACWIFSALLWLKWFTCFLAERAHSPFLQRRLMSLSPLGKCLSLCIHSRELLSLIQSRMISQARHCHQGSKWHFRGSCHLKSSFWSLTVAFVTF